LFVVDNVVVSSEIFKEKFHCNLSKCKGACCWEGDYGAPLNEDEEKVLDELQSKLKATLSAASLSVIEEQGTSITTIYTDKKVTPLLEDGSCVYLVKDENGIAQCGIERLHEAGKSDFKKPISCHLYPIRATEHETTGYDALNYDEWDICKAACSLGEEMNLPVFRFVKDALIRKYGPEFYEQLEHLYMKYFRQGEKS